MLLLLLYSGLWAPKGRLTGKSEVNPKVRGLLFTSSPQPSNSYLLFHFLSFYHLLFIAWKVTKAPGTRAQQSKQTFEGWQCRLFATQAVPLSRHYAWLNAAGIVDLQSKFRNCQRQYPSVKEGAKAHSFGELKLPSSQTLLIRNGVTWTFLLIFGWCGPSSVSHSLLAST